MLQPSRLMMQSLVLAPVDKEGMQMPSEIPTKKLSISNLHTDYWMHPRTADTMFCSYLSKSQC